MVILCAQSLYCQISKDSKCSAEWLSPCPFRVKACSPINTSRLNTLPNCVHTITHKHNFTQYTCIQIAPFRYAQRSRLTPALQERLRLRSADLPVPGGGGSAACTPTAQQSAVQPSTPAGESAFSPLTSAKSVTRWDFFFVLHPVPEGSVTL
jgi:hypothetical protein